MQPRSDKIGGHRIDPRLSAEGGGGYVFSARERATGTLIAVNTLRAFFVSDSAAQERFKQEYTLLESMNHPRIVPTREWGQDPVYGYYYTMPFLAGGTLEDARGTGVFTGKLLNWWIEIVGAILHAHDRDLFHRDLKPKNIVLHQQEPTIVDWGIGRAAGGIHTTTYGTAGWSPPEYRQGGPTGVFTDTYGLAGLLGWILTGQRPDALAANIPAHLEMSGYDIAEVHAFLARGLDTAAARFQATAAMWAAAVPALIKVKRQLLQAASSVEDQLDVFWARLAQNNTNSLQPKTRIFEFHRPIGRNLLTVAYLELTSEQQRAVEAYLELGVRLALSSGRKEDDCQVWRIQTSGGSLMYHEWIFGPEGVDLFRVIKALDHLSSEDLAVVWGFLFISEEQLARRTM